MLSDTDLARDAMRLESFLDDPVIQRVLGLLEREYYDDFKAAENDEDRLRAQAQSLVLDDFLDALRGVLATGEHAALVLAKTAKHSSQLS